MTENFHYTKEYYVELLKEVLADIEEHNCEYDHVTSKHLLSKLKKTLKNEEES
jgi:hypothetical protein